MMNNETLFNDVKKHIIEEAENYINEDMPSFEEFVHCLYERMNTDGSRNFNTFATKENIKKYWNEYGEVFDYISDTFGRDINPFKEPDTLDVLAYIIIIEDIMYNSDFVDLEDFTYTEEMREQLADYLDGIERQYYEY